MRSKIMTRTQRLRMTIDISMTILSIILMGGNFLFPKDMVHEILGVALFVLWGVHIALNRRWYASLAQASKLITSTNDKRNYSFKSHFYIFEYSGRTGLCPHCASACQPLVLSFYVAAYRTACGNDIEQTLSFPCSDTGIF